MWPNAEHLASICRLCRNPKHHKSKRTEEAREGAGERLKDTGSGIRSLDRGAAETTVSPAAYLLTLQALYHLHTLYRVCRSPGAVSGDKVQRCWEKVSTGLRCRLGWERHCTLRVGARRELLN